MLTWRFDGGREMEQALSQLSRRVSRRLVTEALHEAAEPMRKTATTLAPHEPGAPDLKSNIVVSTGRSGERRDGTTFTGPVVNMGPAKGFYYGFFQEYGTAHHAAQPFMRPAFDQQAQKALQIFSAAIWRELAGRGIQRGMGTSDAPVDDSFSRGSEGLGAGTVLTRGGTGL